ncbi:hypothetical protein A1O3_02538 [Capronia epimyces CBS 606.96]|uniref:Uncharacterized protein n=1 Tax=Capronia epimyces CBS 606.96 TaxID=1182542 RepID=W9YJQ7_9EURO|nr:uncharacterized protein A1O3_02538 [Capronia epimyces CBS 606.96]EXJ89471.1 hypothetical protein A1O3_02538 [Capronia epimyces CBS 606.96]
MSQLTSEDSSDMDLTHKYAYISHTSQSLKDSHVIFVSEDKSEVFTVSLRDGVWHRETRMLGEQFGGLDAENVVSAICHKIILGTTTNFLTLVLAGTLTKQLFGAYDGARSFSRENLPFGIQGVQELNWSKQDNELSPLHDAFQKRKREEGEQVVQEKHFDAKGNQLVWMGYLSPFLIVIDRSMMKTAGLVRYHLHSFTSLFRWEQAAFQIFVNVNHPGFVREFRTADPARDMAVVAMVAIRIFTAARQRLTQKLNQGEPAALVEDIKRAAFYHKSVVKESRPEDTAQSVTALVLNKHATTSQKSGPGHLISSKHATSSPHALPSDGHNHHPSISTSTSSSEDTDDDNMSNNSTDQTGQTKKSKKAKKTKKRNKRKKNKTKQEESSGAAAQAKEGGAFDSQSGNSKRNKQKKNKAKQEESSSATAQAKEDGASDSQSRDNKPTPPRQDARQDAPQDADHDITEGLSTALRRVRFSDDLDNAQTSEPAVAEAAAAPGPPIVPKFKFDSMDPRLKCPKPDCRRMTSCWDSAVVICPACGPESYVRYCTKEHLFEDIQRHWVMECEKAKIPGPIDQNTIQDSQIPNRSYVVCQRHNLIERHRQAVYRAMSDSDYFIFNDIDMVDPEITQPTKEQWNAVRGTGRVVLQLVFPNDMTPQSRRRLFDRHILQCLMLGDPLAHASCMTAFQLIREALIISGNWTDEILTYLCMQLAGEWGGFKVPTSFYNVDEVNTMWRNRGLLPMMPTR